MKTRSLILLVLLIVFLFAACSINRPVSATSNPLGSKTGVFIQTGILGFPPMMSKDAATAAAAKNGGITKISTVDYNMTWMIFTMQYKTIVTGE